MLLSELIDEYLDAKKEYLHALEHIPAYTGQWSDADYVRDEKWRLDEARSNLNNYAAKLKEKEE